MWGDSVQSVLYESVTPYSILIQRLPIWQSDPVSRSILSIRNFVSSNEQSVGLMLAGSIFVFPRRTPPLGLRDL